MRVSLYSGTENVLELRRDGGGSKQPRTSHLSAIDVRARDAET